MAKILMSMLLTACSHKRGCPQESAKAGHAAWSSGGGAKASFPEEVTPLLLS